MESEQLANSVTTVSSDLAGTATTLVATALSVDDVLSFSRLSAVARLDEKAPSWDPNIVVNTHRDFILRCETLGTPSDLPIFDSFIKAAHMVRWYNNTIQLWAKSLTLDFGTDSSTVYFGCKLSHHIANGHPSSVTLGVWVALAQYGQLEKYLKWSTALFFAEQLMQEELPPCPPEFEPLMTGNYSWMRHFQPGSDWGDCFRRNIPRRKQVSQGRKWRFAFAKDLYMTKNASLPVDKTFIDGALAKHKKILCGEPEDLLTDETYDEVCEAIQLIADQVFGKIPDMRDNIEDKLVETEDGTIDENTPYITRSESESSPVSRLPSFGASFSRGRGGGGACGDLLDRNDDSEDCLLPEPAEGYFWGFAAHKWNLCEVRTLHDPVVYLDREEQWRREAYTSNSVAAHVVPLVEPFKVRTITKGDAAMYHLARRWQKTIHNRMRRHLNFSLIGQPCNGAFLSQIFGNSPNFDYSNREGFFVSGDYESATDLLNPSLSVFAQDQISQRLRIPLEDQAVLLKCLTGHQLRYEQKGSMYDQQWGQLMGSPTSFPVLCLVNMAATLVSFNRALKRQHQSLSELPICVNGDDVLFWANNEEHYEIWKQITRECGLKFSLGKNYTSRDFCIINSELYLYTRNSRDEPHRSFLRKPFVSALFVQEKALNSRVLSGGSRSAAADGGDPLTFSDEDVDILSPYFKRLNINPYKYLGVKKPIRATSSLKEAVKVARVDYFNGRYAEDFAKWFNTIPSRSQELHEQLQGEVEGEDILPVMRKGAFRAFTGLQIRRLLRFARCDPRLLTCDHSWFLPQHLGGFGIPAPNDHILSANDYLNATTLMLLPEVAMRRANDNRPRGQPLPFMGGIRSEIQELQDTLEIQEELVSAPDFEVLRFNGETQSFWDHEFLIGFVNANNVIAAESDFGDSHHQLDRFFRRSKSGPEFAKLRNHQLQHMIETGVIEESQRTLRGKQIYLEGTVKLGTATPFEEGVGRLVSYRPMPRFV